MSGRWFPRWRGNGPKVLQTDMEELLRMNRTVEDVIAESKRKAVRELKDLQVSVGEICDAWRAYIDISGEWKNAADKAFNIDLNESRRNLFTARAASLSVLTTRILTRAGEMPKLLSSGAIESMVVNWRYISETKNIAMMIDMDVLGPSGFLWLHHGMIDQAKANGAGGDSRKFAELSKELLAKAGFQYDRNAKDPWAVGLDEKKYSNAVDRNRYVWGRRNFPKEFTKRDRSFMAEAEQELIKVANGFTHPSLVPHERIKGTIHAMLLSAFIDPMGVMLAYKGAASDKAGWEYTKTVGEQFHVYPSWVENAETLSYIVRDMQSHCIDVFRNRFLPEN